MDPSVLDDIINRLREVRLRPGKQVQLSESEIRQLCVVSREIFLKQPNLLELCAPIKICDLGGKLEVKRMERMGKEVGFVVEDVYKTTRWINPFSMMS